MIHYSTIIFVVILVIMLYLTFKNYGANEGGMGNIAILSNAFFGMLLIIFVLIWGGIFWW